MFVTIGTKTFAASISGAIYYQDTNVRGSSSFPLDLVRMAKIKRAPSFNDEENPTIGILLCSSKNDTAVKMALPENNNTILASEYQLDIVDSSVPNFIELYEKEKNKEWFY